MNIYFACSITGGRSDEPVYQIIVEALEKDGHEVPTAMLASPEAMALEAVAGPVEIYMRDTNWIEACSALVAEVSTPSHGVGFEICYALDHDKLVLCLYRPGVKVSKMIAGNRHPNLTIRTYRDPQDAVDILRQFLDTLEE